MSITLFEDAKLNSIDANSMATQFTIAESSMIFGFLPFVNVDDFQFTEEYDTEESRSAFRAINEELAEGSGDIAKLQFTVAPLGRTVQVDRVLIKAKGMGAFSKRMSQEAFGIGATYNENFIKGDQQSNPREFNGLQVIVEDQLPASQTTTSGVVDGSALSLLTLDKFLASIRGGAQIIFCSESLSLRFTAAGRDSTVAGFVNYLPNDPATGLGTAITMYNGIPIVPVKGTFNNDDILPFDEISPFAGSTAPNSTSLYAARLGADGLYGAQMGGVVTNDFGNIPGSVFHKGDIEWVPGVGVAHPLTVARYGGILDAAITV